MNRVYEFLSSLKIKENDVIVVAVSYGPDSMFLLNVLKDKFLNNKIVCAHVNHNVRKESEKEAMDLKHYCNENNIIFEFMKIDKYKNNKFSEEEARKKRYDFFDLIMEKYDSKYLFTAHHGDDLAETILMRIARGSNLRGYSGIYDISTRKNYNVIRPLLYLTKDEIKNMCDEIKLPYAVDKSNLNNNYTRNRYRNIALKFFKEENKNVTLKFLEFSNTLKEYDNYVNGVVKKVYKKVVTDDVLNIAYINNEDKFIIKKVIELYLFNIYKDKINLINNRHTKKVMDLIECNKPNIRISMPNRMDLIKSYNKIYFDNKKEYNDFCYILYDEVELPDGSLIKKIDKLTSNSNYVTAFNRSEISFPIYVRNKKDGDVIEILNLNGKKKIKDIFIDEKIELSKRNNYPVLVDSNGNVLWLPGIKKSKYDRSKYDNYDIIFKYQKGGL